MSLKSYMQSNVTNVRTARCRPNQSKRDDDGKARRLDDLRRQRLYEATCSGRGNTTGSEPCAGRPACRPSREVGSRTQSPARVFDLGDAAAVAAALAGMAIVANCAGPFAATLVRQ